MEGNKNDKKAFLNNINDLNSIFWKTCSNIWHSPFYPNRKGNYFNFPLITDLMPWQHSGVQFTRTWPIGVDIATLKERWRVLMESDTRDNLFKESRDRKIAGEYQNIFYSRSEIPIIKLTTSTPSPNIIRYAYRSFIRCWVILDNRLGDFLRPILWRNHSERQLYFISLFSQPLGKGPAITACADPPDLDYYRGSYGAKATFPLYRDNEGKKPNILEGLLNIIKFVYKFHVTPEDFLAYLYGILAQPHFTELYASELETCEIRVPITKDAKLFKKVHKVGAKLLWLHTYGERYVLKGMQRGKINPGSTRCIKPVPGDIEDYPETFEFYRSSQKLRVGAGEFQPVMSEVYDFEVSGLKIVQSWLKYRMKKGAGKKSSPLDDIRPERWTSQFTTELLELLWILEETVKVYPEQAELLEQVVSNSCFTADELPPVPKESRKPPKIPQFDNSLFDGEKG